MLYWAFPLTGCPKEVLEREASDRREGGRRRLDTTQRSGKISLQGDLKHLTQSTWLSAPRAAEGSASRRGCAGVIGGIDFLRLSIREKPVQLGKRVMVVGGGNVAVDVALTAKRSGAERCAHGLSGTLGRDAGEDGRWSSHCRKG